MRGWDGQNTNAMRPELGPTLSKPAGMKFLFLYWQTLHCYYLHWPIPSSAKLLPSTYVFSWSSMYSEMSAEPLIDGHRQCDQMLEYKVVNFFNSCPNVATLVFTQKVIFFKVSQKVTIFIWVLLKEHLSPRTFKIRPIWSHWSPHLSEPYLKTFLFLYLRRLAFYQLAIGNNNN